MGARRAGGPAKRGEVGRKVQVISLRPLSSSFLYDSQEEPAPFMAIMDEFAYYMAAASPSGTSGMAPMAAQARSVGWVSIVATRGCRPRFLRAPLF